MKINWLAFCGAQAVGMIGLAAIVAAELGYRINTTASMPIGIWRTTPLDRPLKRGDVVVFCMPDSPITQMALQRRYVGPGDCPSHTEPLLKPVAAVAGDTVMLTSNGVAIDDDEILNNSAPLTADPHGRPLPILPRGAYHIAEGEVWLMSLYSSLGFDSRYYGNVKISSLRGRATPVWIW